MNEQIIIYRRYDRVWLYLVPPANEVWGKVIFLHLSVILFKGGVPGQVPPGKYTPLAGTPPGRYTPQQVHPQQVPPPGPATHAGIRSTSGRYASYWNAFLFLLVLVGCSTSSSISSVSNVSWYSLIILSRLATPKSCQLIPSSPLMRLFKRLDRGE